MIPDFNLSGVLPPFLSGQAPNISHAVSPYRVSLIDFVKKFCTSPIRHKILIGFIDYRISLKHVGINNGFQWIDGSFVENVETTKGRDPRDLDLITFAHRPEPHKTDSNWKNFVTANIGLFSPDNIKQTFHCDGYYIDLNLPSVSIVNNTRYWFGLFSHQRDTYLWKGMLEINMQEQEHVAQQYLTNGGNYAP